MPDWWERCYECRWSAFTALWLPARHCPRLGGRLARWNDIRQLGWTPKGQHGYEITAIWTQFALNASTVSGFDLKQLFIGSEGTIGIITGVSILTPKRPTAMNVAVFSLSSYEDVQKVYNETKAGLGEILSAFEFFDKQAYDLVKRHMKEGGEAERKVFENEGEFYVLVETGGSNNDHDEEVNCRIYSPYS